MRSSPTARSLLTACWLAVASVLAPAAASAGALPNRERVVLSQGHVDAVHVTSVDGQLRVDLKDGTGDEAVLRDPGTVLIHAGDGAKVELPSIDEYPEYAFLGKTGQTVWILPEIQIDGVTWPGWNTEDVDPSVFPHQELTWRMLSVDGPGRFHQFVSDAVGTPHLFFDGGKPWPQTNPIINRSHTHANWSFEKEGLYVMRLEIEGRRADGVRVVSDPVEYRFFIGDLAAVPEDPPVVVDPGEDDGPADPAPGGEPMVPTTPVPPTTPVVPTTPYRPTTPEGPAAPTLPTADASMAGPAAPSVPAAPQATALPRPLSADVTVRRAAVAPRTLSRSRALTASCTLGGVGRCDLRLHISASAARKLGVAVRGSARTVTIARGSASFAAAGTKIVRLTIGVRGRAILRRAGDRLTAQLTTTTDGPGRRWQRVVEFVELGSPAT